MAGEAGRNTVRRHVIYTGQVQGVFFRVNSEEISHKFAVTGYVRNLPDGSVELEAEGTLDQVEAYLTAVQQRFNLNIRSAEMEDRPPRGDEAAFVIRY